MRNHEENHHSTYGHKRASIYSILSSLLKWNLQHFILAKCFRCLCHYHCWLKGAASYWVICYMFGCWGTKLTIKSRLTQRLKTVETVNGLEVSALKPVISFNVILLWVSLCLLLSNMESFPQVPETLYEGTLPSLSFAVFILIENYCILPRAT